MQYSINMNTQKQETIVRISLEISEDMRRAVKIEAAKRGHTMRDIFIDAVSEYLSLDQKTEETQAEEDSLEDF